MRRVTFNTNEKQAFVIIVMMVVPVSDLVGDNPVTFSESRMVIRTINPKHPRNGKRHIIPVQESGD